MLVVPVDFSQYFTYDETSPTCLRWAVSRYSGQGRRLMVTKGDVAGHRSKMYHIVQVHGVKYRCHRVVWSILVGNISSDDVIDHRDGDSLNNKFSNLRLANQKVNSENRGKSIANRSGVTGVALSVCKKGNVTYSATWKVDRKTMSKKFSVNVHGLLPAFSMACEFRKGVIARLNKQGASYTERHGK